MKKVLLGILLMSISYSAMAQEESIVFGLKAGVNLANIVGDSRDGLAIKTGFHFGGLVEIPISEKVALQAEVLYTSQGAKLDFSENRNGNIFIINGDVKLNYLTIPLLAKYYILKGYSIQAGPQLGFLLSAKNVGEESVNGVVSAVDDNFSDVVLPFDLGVNVGMGYQMDFGLFVEGRYNISLTDINYFSPFRLMQENKTQNSVFQFSVGYKF